MTRMTSISTMHPDLLAAKKYAYVPSRLCFTNVLQEAESQEYGACTFDLDGRRIMFRVAKITPTKIGQFVTLWKRIGTGPIMPYDIADPVALFVVSVRSAQHFGQFVFPKAVLRDKGVVSQAGKGGKRAMRVYPPWDVTDNSQAKKTQAWQRAYFFEIPADGGINTARIRNLFGL